MRAFLISVILLMTSAATSTQQPMFRSGTRVVPVVTTVMDTQGRLVSRLEREEFTLLDNGKPQEITFFEYGVQPFTVVVMLDYSASMTGNLELLKSAAEQFVARLLPTDRGQVGSFSDTIQFSGEFTNDRDDLTFALDDLPFGDRTRLYDAIDESITALRDIKGRRVLLVFTDGDDTASRVGFGDVLERAREEDVTISAIRLELDGVAGAGKRSRADQSLKRLVEHTGGGYFELTKSDDLVSAFTRVAEELHSQYTLGFTPSMLDGREHKLVVRMKQPVLNARARRSYVASPEHFTDSE